MSDNQFHNCQECGSKLGRHDVNYCANCGVEIPNYQKRARKYKKEKDSLADGKFLKWMLVGAVLLFGVWLFILVPHVLPENFIAIYGSESIIALWLLSSMAVVIKPAEWIANKEADREMPPRSLDSFRSQEGGISVTL